tara:strand:+ start:12 stop:812 length:801 start_codon:yes stop_codon:yes gene_type:complete
MQPINSKVKSEPGLSLSQSKEQVDFYINGYLLMRFNNKKALKNLLNLLQKEIDKFNNGDRKKWKQTFGGAFDMVNDKCFTDFIKKNQILDSVNNITNQEYTLGDIKLRMWTPGEGYLNAHRDTYLDKKGKIIGKIPPDINVFFYPQLNNKKTSQLYIYEKTHRRDFDNFLINWFIKILSKKRTIYSNNNQFVMFNSAIIHALPRYKNFLPVRLKRKIQKLLDYDLKRKKFYPRLIIRFCAIKNSNIYNRGKDINEIQLPSLSKSID